MKCSKCYQEIGNAYTCPYCGSKIIDDNSSKLLLTYIIITAVCTILGGLIGWAFNFFNNYNFWNIIFQLIYIIRNLSIILVPLAIKNMKIRIIALVITIPIVLYWIVFNIISILRT